MPIIRMIYETYDDLLKWFIYLFLLGSYIFQMVKR